MLRFLLLQLLICTVTAQCEANPCFFGVECVLSGGEPLCVCPPGFGSNHCQSIVYNSCTSSPCQNAGSCFRNPGGGYLCVCPDNYLGSQCQTLTNYWCESSSCQNGATCLNITNGHTCTCLQGFSGNECQTNINECSSSPCRYGEVCVDVIGGYQCSSATKMFISQFLIGILIGILLITGH